MHHVSASCIIAYHVCQSSHIVAESAMRTCPTYHSPRDPETRAPKPWYMVLGSLRGPHGKIVGLKCSSTWPPQGLGHIVLAQFNMGRPQGQGTMEVTSAARSMVRSLSPRCSNKRSGQVCFGAIWTAQILEIRTKHLPRVWTVVAVRPAKEIACAWGGWAMHQQTSHAVCSDTCTRHGALLCYASSSTTAGCLRCTYMYCTT